MNELPRIASGDCSQVTIKRLPSGDVRAEFGPLLGIGPDRTAACRAIIEHARIRCCELHPVAFIPVGQAPENPDDGAFQAKHRVPRNPRR